MNHGFIGAELKEKNIRRIIQTYFRCLMVIAELSIYKNWKEPVFRKNVDDTGGCKKPEKFDIGSLTKNILLCHKAILY